MPRIHSAILSSAAAFKMPGLASMMPPKLDLSLLNTSMGMIPPMPHVSVFAQMEEFDRLLLKHKKKEGTDQKS